MLPPGGTWTVLRDYTPSNTYNWLVSGKPAGDSTAGVKLTRPLCPYPRTARYRGNGSGDDAGSFVCSEAKPAR